MSINGMIDRAKLAKKYITDKYVKPYNIYDASMKSYYIDRAGCRRTQKRTGTGTV
ncbi:MAG: hypothetical protein ACLS4P_07525 [Dorea sp.]